MLIRLLGLGGGWKLGGAADTRSPYRLRDDFLSPAEISFYHVLLQVAGERVTVCPKVGLGDVFFVSRPNENAGARNRIAAKHVDFLLCDSMTMRPLAGIELDDASHRRADRQERDALVEKVFEAAELPLVRFPAKRAYTLAEVEGKLSVVFGNGMERGRSPTDAPVSPAIQKWQGSDGSAACEPPAPAPAEPSVPMCPKCGIPLVIRSGPRGNFFGCSNFPKCRVTVNTG